MNVQRIDMEKFLISIVKKQQKIADQIYQKFEGKALFEGKEIEEIQKMVNETQEQFNQYLIPESISIGG